MRLNTFLARSGSASRRGSDALIAEGRVAINGVTAVIGAIIQLGDEVTLDGVLVSPQKLTYILLHKPAGTITTAHDPQGRPTVIELVECDERVFPVGRLDADTTGVLFLTNDGVLAHYLAHPRYVVEKTYIATVKGSPSVEALRCLETGIELDDGMTAPARARLLEVDKSHFVPGKSIVELVIHEGRKHQVKRMMAAIGHPVSALHRSQYASLTVGDLAPGGWRNLRPSELGELREITAE